MSGRPPTLENHYPAGAELTCETTREVQEKMRRRACGSQVESSSPQARSEPPAETLMAPRPTGSAQVIQTSQPCISSHSGIQMLPEQRTRTLRDCSTSLSLALSYRISPPHAYLIINDSCTKRRALRRLYSFLCCFRLSCSRHSSSKCITSCSYRSRQARSRYFHGKPKHAQTGRDR